MAADPPPLPPALPRSAQPPALPPSVVPPPLQRSVEPPPLPRRPKRMSWAAWLLIGGLLGLPLLGLWLAYLASQHLASALPARWDAVLSRPLWEQLQRSSERCSDGSAQRYVDALVQPLIGAAGATPFEFEFMVVRDPAVNAFALPGGYVVVNQGLLEAAESGEEVAAVLAHEMSHVTERHGTQRLLRALGGSLMAWLIFGSADAGVLLNLLSELQSKGFDRSQEAEADTQGLRLLERAGISPRGMASFFRRLSSERSLPELLSTHPDPGSRAEDAERAAGGPTRIALPQRPESWSCGGP